MSTIKDVARRAGVAISTVSAVINRSAPVSEDTIARVDAAIAAIGYTPHGGAQSLRSGRSRLIGLVVPNVANPHFAAVAREVENVCLSAGYTTVVYSTGQDAERESQVLKMMRVQRVAGLIVIPTRSDAEHGAALINQIHVPTVLLDMYVEGLPYDVIKTDNIEAGRLATEYLLSLGHTEIGLIVGIPGLATSDDRHTGYRKAFHDHGLEPDPSLTWPGNFDQQTAHDATLALLDRKSPPTAIVTISNMMTVGLLFALRERGLTPPDDLSIVGIDDLEFARLLDPQPTTVETPILLMARKSIELLLKQIANRISPTGERSIHQPQLIVRQSAARLDAPTSKHRRAVHDLP
ncbi:MAG: LacI family DNA-binding transcriptional regulator [Devosia sp.]